MSLLILSRDLSPDIDVEGVKSGPKIFTIKSVKYRQTHEHMYYFVVTEKHKNVKSTVQKGGENNGVCRFSIGPHRSGLEYFYQVKYGKK